MSVQRQRGRTGIVGAVFLLFAFLSMLWATVDPDLTIEPWFALSVQFLGGFMLSYALGFRVTNRVTIGQEIEAVTAGAVAGVFSVGMMQLILYLDAAFSYASYGGEALWIVMLAPISETFALVVFIYELFEEFFPEMAWFQKAVPSNLAFAFLHFFSYSANALWPLIIIILIIGNTFLFYVYHVTRNATAPLVGHTIINFSAAKPAVLAALFAALPIFLVMFVGLFVLYIIIGGVRTS